MPAAAVIPAPIAYTNVAAVKTLVVGLRDGGCSEALCGWSCCALGCDDPTALRNKPTAFDLHSSHAEPLGLWKPP